MVPDPTIGLWTGSLPTLAPAGSTCHPNNIITRLFCSISLGIPLWLAYIFSSSWFLSEKRQAPCRLLPRDPNALGFDNTLVLTMRHRSVRFRSSYRYLPGSFFEAFSLTAHHRISWMQQRQLVWGLPLQVDPGGPSSIIDTASKLTYASFMAHSGQELATIRRYSRMLFAFSDLDQTKNTVTSQTTVAEA